MEKNLSDISLRNGQKANECLRLGYPLNDMEITSKARELQRKRLKGNA